MRKNKPSFIAYSVCDTHGDKSLWQRIAIGHGHPDEAVELEPCSPQLQPAGRIVLVPMPASNDFAADLEALDTGIWPTACQFVLDRGELPTPELLTSSELAALPANFDGRVVVLPSKAEDGQEGGGQ